MQTARSKDDRGQVLSSLVAVLAVVAIVAGLLVLFGTRGDDSVADTKPSAKPTSTTPAPTSAPATTSAPTSAPTAAPTSAPTAEPTTAPTTAPTVPPVKTLAPVQQRPAVEVYNNTNRKGLADSVAGRARQAGWTVAGADNWHGKIVASTVYYPAGMLAEATQLAKDLGVSRVKDALPNMKKDRLSVILTTDYTG